MLACCLAVSACCCAILACHEAKRQVIIAAVIEAMIVATGPAKSLSISYIWSAQGKEIGVGGSVAFHVDLALSAALSALILTGFRQCRNGRKYRAEK